MSERSVCFQCATVATKRCGRCLVPSYCGADCQREHWPEHKGQCKQLAKSKLPVKLRSNLEDVEEGWVLSNAIKISQKVNKEPEIMGIGKPTKKYFKVKAQHSYTNHSAILAALQNWKEMSLVDELRIYDREQSIDGMINRDDENFAAIRDVILEKGVHGVMGGMKAYLYADFHDDTMYVQIANVLPPDPTW